MSCVCPVYVLCMSCVCLACTRRAVRSTSSVKSYLRSNLTADSRTSPVPAIFHFFIHFYYFHSISFHIDVREIYDLHCILSYGVSFTIHSVRRASGVHSFLSSSVKSYLRSNLTADYRTSPVPAIFHFFIPFYYFHSISFHIDVREIYKLHCILSYGVSLTIHSVLHQISRTSVLYSTFLLLILHSFLHSFLHSSRRLSFVYPVYVLCISCVYPVYVRHPFRSTSSVKSYLRSNLTADSRTSPVPAILHFFIHFYYFHLSMFERFMNYIVSFSYCVSFTIHCVRCSSCTHPVLILHSSCIHPFCILVCILCVCPVYVLSISDIHPACIRHPILSIIFGLILPSVLSYRGF